LDHGDKKENTFNVNTNYYKEDIIEHVNYGAGIITGKIFDATKKVRLINVKISNIEREMDTINPIKGINHIANHISLIRINKNKKSDQHILEEPISQFC